MITASTNVKEFRNALREYASKCKSELSVVVNRVAKDVSFTALRLTPKTDPMDIERDLSTETIAKTWVAKKGKFAGQTRRKVVSYKPTKLVYKILNSRRTANGLPGYSRSEMGSAAHKFIARKKSSCGILKGGVIELIKKLKSSAPESAPRPRIQRSDSVLAKPGISPTASLEYGVSIKRQNKDLIHPGVVSAFSTALQVSAKDMMDYVKRKLSENWKNHGGQSK